MRILIVGAGIAGLTLAGLLKQKGHRPDLVERASDFSQAGYMLGLYPLGSRVLHGLGLFEEFASTSVPMRNYNVCNGKGELVHGYDLTPLFERFGLIGQLMRGELLELLRSSADDLPLRMGTSVTSLKQTESEVEVTFSDDSRSTYDLVVGADGIHSHVRREVFGQLPEHKTGWGCWVFLLEPAKAINDTVTEYWGAGRLVGVYPTKDRLGVIAAGPENQVGPEATSGELASIKKAFSELEGAPKSLLESIEPSEEKPYFWRLSDVRAKRWFAGRVALCGDSACAFLPTAGVGASMAMESAAVLADELGRTDAKFIPRALELYEKRRKKRCEGAQDDSRKLAKMMMVELKALAWGRDQLMRFYSLEMLAENIAKSLDEPI